LVQQTLYGVNKILRPVKFFISMAPVSGCEFYSHQIFFESKFIGLKPVYFEAHRKPSWKISLIFTILCHLFFRKS